MSGHFLHNHPRHSDSVVSRLPQFAEYVSPWAAGRQKMDRVGIKDEQACLQTDTSSREAVPLRCPFQPQEHQLWDAPP
ncbi:hypothetical protein Stsp01_65560 [Streptomyces sp. NBRC 13847]|nr:hypothetical protein Stsp01_65560 [Streptomyces sp. NBRC 13847]